MKKLIALLLISSMVLTGCISAPQHRPQSVPVTTVITTTTTTTTSADGTKTVVTECQTAPQRVIVVREYPYYGPYGYRPNWHFGINWVFGGHGHRGHR